MKTLEAIKSLEDGEIVVLVDEAAARDSVIRTARALGLPYEVGRSGDDFELTIRRGSYGAEKS